jgi:DNA-binding LacI/PurR family transcriptional regulator
MVEKRKSATLQEVALDAGVSVSTVSRVLNSADFAKAETRDAVIKAAVRTGYTRLRRPGVMDPTLVAAGYQRDDSALKSLVLLAPQTTFDSLKSQDWIFRDIVPTLYQAARDNGYQLVLSSYSEDDQWTAIKAASENVAGIIWMADHGHARWMALLSHIAKLAPVVVVNNDTTWPPRTCVVVNNRAVVFKAVEHLVELGHHRIGYFDADDADDTHCRERLDAYHQAVVHFGLDADPSVCVLEEFGVNEHPPAVARAMDRLSATASVPTAIIAPLGYAIQFLKETRMRKVRVPRDMSVMAIDDAHAAELVDPALTVIDCGYRACAEAAVKLIIEQTESSKPAIKTVLLDPTLIVRDSTAPPRSAG